MAYIQSTRIVDYSKQSDRSAYPVKVPHKVAYGVGRVMDRPTTTSIVVPYAVYMIDIYEEAVKNTDYRKVMWTGDGFQLVFMSLLPFEMIDRETHKEDQMIRVEEGKITVVIEFEDERKEKVEYVLTPGKAINIAGGSIHTVIAGPEGAKLSTIYGPGHHRPDILQHIKPAASPY